jgi:colicin import membrane protein
MRGIMLVSPLAAAMILAAAVAGCLTGADLAAENGRTEDLGTAAAGKTGPAISRSEANKIVAMLRDQLTRCWVPPAGTGVPAVTVRFELSREGWISNDPVVVPVNPVDLQSARFQPAADSALRAVRSCTPLRLPAAGYEVWRDVEITFDPKMKTSGAGEARR